MRKLVFTIIIAFFMLSESKAHDYNTGIGIRGGFHNGITFKHFISDNVALEALLTSRWRGYMFTLLYEIHKPAFSTPRLNWYYGIGGHIGSWNGKYTHGYWGDKYKDGQYTVIGVDFILGLEYNFIELPFNLSIDWKPAFNLVGHNGFWGDGGALSLRYIF